LLLVARLLPWIPYKIELPILCPSTCSGRTEFSYFRATLSTHSKPRRAHYSFYEVRKMAEKGLTKRDLEQTFAGFEKRRDEKMKAFGKRVVDQFHIISEGLVDQIKLLAEGHAGIIERLTLMEKENERQHLETRSLVKLSFAPAADECASSLPECRPT